MSTFKKGTVVKIIDYSGFTLRTRRRFQGRVCVLDEEPRGNIVRIRLYSADPTESFQVINVLTRRLVRVAPPESHPKEPVRKVLAPEFGPVPESGVTTVHSIGEMLPYQVYAFVLSELGRVHPGQKVKYLMRCSVDQALSQFLWVNTNIGWLSDSVPLHSLDSRVDFNVTGTLGQGVFKLVPVYDYPAMSYDMNTARNILIWSLNAQA